MTTNTTPHKPRGPVPQIPWPTYRFIIEYKLHNGGCSPALQDIISAGLCKSTSAADYQIERLQAAGLIELGRGYRARDIRVVGAQWIPPAGYEAEPIE